MENHWKLPKYLVDIVKSYLSDRFILVEHGKNNVSKYNMSRGVPQGSVLGPLFWNMTYDMILREKLPEDCSIVSFADDTMLIVGGNDENRMHVKIKKILKQYLCKIKKLGLSITPEKTEAMIFCEKPREYKWLHEKGIVIENCDIRFSDNIKYLGVILDNKLRYESHLFVVSEKAKRVERALSQLMHNVKGPKECRRRLYAHVIFSVVLYAAPIWASKDISNKGQVYLNRIYRSTCNRVISGYRTVSGTAAGVTAKFPPLEIIARQRMFIFNRLRFITRNDYRIVIDIERKNAIILEEKDRAFSEWKESLNKEVFGFHTREIIVPIFDDWINQSYGNVNYYLTQILTGHGNFNNYLFKIKKRESAKCEFCISNEIDDTIHTLFVCQRWQGIRIRHGFEDFMNQNNWSDFNQNHIKDIILKMCRSMSEWIRFDKLINDIMKTKDKLEREIPIDQSNIIKSNRKGKKRKKV